MSKYTLTIEGDFEKGECYGCPLSYTTSDIHYDETEFCVLGANYNDCPLEEVKQGEWIKTIDDVVCSLCGESANLDADEYFIRDKVRFHKSDFCPNCGTPMKGGK